VERRAVTDREVIDGVIGPRTSGEG
jgi:hypothetical protein